LDPHQPQLEELPRQVRTELAPLIHLAHMGLDLIDGEAPNRISKQQFFLTETSESVWGRFHWLSWRLSWLSGEKSDSQPISFGEALIPNTDEPQPKGGAWPLADEARRSGWPVTCVLGSESGSRIFRHVCHRLL